MLSVATPVADVRTGDRVCRFQTDEVLGTVTLIEVTADGVRYKDDNMIFTALLPEDVKLWIIR